jgi:hypothetical protein
MEGMRVENWRSGWSILVKTRRLFEMRVAQEGEGTVKIYDGIWVLDSADEVCE